jgi:3-carboxy-cis,cis-muconate cycloisomerase
MTANAFDHPWLSGLFGDAEMGALWSAQTQLEHMLAFEAAWSQAGAAVGLWPQDQGDKAALAIKTAKIAPADLRAGTGRDGVCVPDLVQHLRALVGDGALHVGATSQDVVDTATSLSILASLKLIAERLGALDRALSDLESRFGAQPLMGRTRMQAAVMIKVADRIAPWRLPLHDHQNRISALMPRVARVQIGGAAGDRAALGAKALPFVDHMAKSLGLAATERSWHAMRDGIGEFASLLSLVTVTLGKLAKMWPLWRSRAWMKFPFRGEGAHLQWRISEIPCWPSFWSHWLGLTRCKFRACITRFYTNKSVQARLGGLSG